MSLKGLRILVTGAGGCVGAFVLKGLLDKGAIPVVLDLSKNKSRLNLLLPEEETTDTIWEIGDITDYDNLLSIIKKHNIEGIIHLAALQVPFAKADPILGTRVNVMGTVNILEAARQSGITRLSYASSIASPAMDEGSDALSTLYGAHKLCGELMAAVYWQDWEVPSVGIRPSIVYGLGRDQGMSAAPTIAMLAGFSDIEYTIPFSGDVSFIYVEDAAACFIRALEVRPEGAPVFDMNGTQHSVEFVIEQVKKQYPHAQIDFTGGPLPFPAEADDGSLLKFLDLPPYRKMEDGITQTLLNFNKAKQRGALTDALALELIGKNV